ncbi:MAG: ABC transporter permease [Anaerolineae bacterium]|nr:ABC transporter permease [Anaerolineae bacterium]MDW8171206.1 ABC transporter permease [Anaerolineae bacterium]
MGRIPRQYLLRRLRIFILTIWASATLIWIIPRLAPGDPISAMVGQMSQAGGYVEGSEEIIEGFRARFGLDQPLPIQYLRYLLNLITLDFGYSIASFPTPVSQIIGQALPWTFGLLVLAMTITFLLGNALGALMIWTHTPHLIKVLIPLGMVFTSIPSILSGLFLLYIFAFILNWFPVQGAYALGIIPGLNLPFILSVIQHGTLPALAVILVNFGYWALGMRGMMITVQGEDYVQLARAKGLNPLYVLYRYMIRNAILPQITAFAITLGTLVSGQVLVEYIFGYQGMGKIIYDAILARDFAVIQGASFIVICMTAGAVMVVDLTYPLVDPRISHGGE